MWPYRGRIMKRRAVLLLASSAATSVAGCSQFQVGSTDTTKRSTTKRSTTNPGELCGPVVAENIRIDSRSSESHEIRIEVQARNGSEQTILDEMRTVPAPDDTSESVTVWIEGAVEEEGTYHVRASLDAETTETYRWRVTDGCDDLGIEITPDGELRIGVLPEG